jgi:hypothetical protein
MKALFYRLFHVETTQIEVSLREPSHYLPFVLAVSLASLLLAGESSLVGIVSSFQSPAVGRLMLAVDSGDAQLQFWLGRAYQDSNPAEGIRHLRRATELSPYSRLYWDELASACQSARDIPCADGARQRLLELCPMVPVYHWYAAERSLRIHRLPDAVAQFRRLLELDPSYATSVWSSLALVEPADATFQGMFANRADATLEMSYVDYVSGKGEDAAAYRSWRRMAANPVSFPFSSAQPYLERLIGAGRFAEAAAVWQDLERLGIVKAPVASPSDNLVFNGDFEQFPLNAGFDWRWSDQLTYLAIDFADPAAYHGAHCLRIDFTVSQNEEYEPVYQILAVLPRRTYRLDAYVRSEDITSDTGPSLKVSDTQQPGVPDAVSETTVGTTQWHPVHLYFSTGPKTQAVRLSVWRPRSRVFPTEISGSFWLDAVSLECLDCDR